MSGYSLHFHGYHPLKVLITLCNNESTHIIAEKSEIQANKVIPSNIQKIKATNSLLLVITTANVTSHIDQCIGKFQDR